MIEMLNHLGLTVSWQKAMKLFDDKKNRSQDVSEITPDNIPVMLLIDNVNLYRGKRKHLRIFRRQGQSTMWNFTVEAMLIPQLDGIRELLLDKQFSLSPQGDVTKMDPDDMCTENHKEKLDVFEAFVDRYLLGLLDDCLNNVPFTTSQLKNMSEQEVNKTLTNEEAFKNLHKRQNRSVSLR